MKYPCISKTNNTYLFQLILSLFIISIISISCSKKNTKKIETIEVNVEANKSINLSDIIQTSKIIKLETSQDFLISRIRDIFITEEYIFVLGGKKGLLQFKRNGKFVRAIGKNGKGPFEHNGIFSFTCDTIKSRIYMAAFTHIYCFSFEGTPMFSIKYIKNRIDEFMTIQNGQLISFYTDYGKLDASTFFNRQKFDSYNQKGKIIRSTLLREIKLPNEMGTILPTDRYISKTNIGTYFYYPVMIQEPTVRDTLYEFNNNAVTPSLKLDFGDRVYNSKRKEIYIKNIYRSDRYVFANYSTAKNNQRYFLCHDLKKGNQYNMKNGINDDIYNTGKIILKNLNTPNDEMYFVKDAFEVCDQIEGITEDSNPVIFIFKLKE